MAKPRTCANCAAFAAHAHSSFNKLTDGTCRRRAPAMPINGDRFPPVRHNDWCLDHVERDSKAGSA